MKKIIPILAALSALTACASAANGGEYRQVSSAEAQKLINLYRQHYPSKEDVFFTPELKPGTIFHIGGWMNEDVRCRD